jgi:hypothetical protein
MAYTPFSTGSIYNGSPLNALYGKTLWSNMQHSAQNRLKKFALTYYPTAHSTIGSATTVPPSYDTTLQGMSGTLWDGEKPDPNTVGLQFSSSPVEPICLPPISWPLSAHANTIKINMNLRVDLADVDVYAYARIGQAYYPASVSDNSLVLDGEIQFYPRIKDSDSFVTVGTSTATNTDSTYIQLEIGLGGAQGFKDTAVHNTSMDPIVGRSCELFIAFQSREGDKVIVTDQPVIASLNNNGSLIGTDIEWDSFQDFLAGLGEVTITGGDFSGLNNWHTWAVFDTTVDIGGTLQASQSKRQIIQHRPSNTQDITGSFVNHVISPPILDIEPFHSGSEYDYYHCGKVTLYSVFVEEEF